MTSDSLQVFYIHIYYVYLRVGSNRKPMTSMFAVNFFFGFKFNFSISNPYLSAIKVLRRISMHSFVKFNLTKLIDSNCD